MRVLPEPSGRTRSERALADLDRVERPAQLARAFGRETSADLAGEDETAFLVEADQQRTDPFARSLGIGEAADHEFLAVDALRFEPAGALAALIRLVARLRDDPFETEAARFADGGGAVRLQVIRELDARAADDLLQRSLARFERLADERPPIQVEEVEREVDQPAAVGAREILQRLEARASVGEDHAHFTVDEGRGDLQRLGAARDLREVRRPVV